MDVATGEWVFQEVEHGKELSRWNLHVITKESSNDRVMHDRLVRLVLEVAVPTRAEFVHWPRVHLLELLLRGANLDTGFDAVGGKRTSAIDVPLLEDLVLRLLIAADEVVE
jgi:hypothetical protein